MRVAAHGNRLDALDGIRTIAVGLVIAFHVSMPYMDGGYLGVDMFFVLSGYLITAGLVRQIRRDGRIDAAAFWARRFKRLMPAALLTIIAVVIWANLAAPVYRHADLGADVWWTTFYVANWHFFDAGSYFSSDGTVSPLLHMWSLAVEEQFYILWPLLILGAIGMTRLWRGERRERIIRLMILIAVIIIAVSVALLYIHSVRSSTNRAYMGTDAKAFEPMLGALAAIVVSYERPAELARRYARPLLWAGGLSMIGLFAVLDGPPPFYYAGGALAFSLGMTAVILGIAHNLTGWEARLLAWPPIAYLGRISYGLYLWHWPWAVWLLDESQGFQPARALLVVALTFVCAAASYHLVEMPIRQGRISRLLTTRKTFAAAAAGMILMAGSTVSLGGTPAASAYTVARNMIAPPSVNEDVIMLVGDSVPRRITPALEPVAAERGLTLVSAARGSCTPMGLHMVFGLEEETGHLCPEVIDIQNDMLATYRPGTVLWWSRYEIIDRYDGDTLLSPDTEEFWVAQERDFIATADRLTADGATLVVVLTERPGIGTMTRSEAALSTNLIQLMINHDEYRQRFNEIVTRVASTRDDIRTVDGDALFCEPGPGPGPGSLCDDTVDGHLLRPDGSHIDNDRFGADVARDLLDRVVR